MLTSKFGCAPVMSAEVRSTFRKFIRGTFRKFSYLLLSKERIQIIHEDPADDRILKCALKADAQGQKRKGYVYANGRMVVKQWGGYLYWQQADPVTAGTRSEATAGYLYADAESGEVDPLGNDVGRTDPYAADESADYGGGYAVGGDAFDESGGGCMVDGLPRSCSEAMFMLNMGIAEQCPNNYCGAKIVRIRNGDGKTIGQRLSSLIRDPDSGWLGYPDIVKEEEAQSAPPQNTSKTLLHEAVHSTGYETCDQRLARMFGGPGAVVGSSHDPSSIKQIADTWAKIGRTPPAAGVPRGFGHGPEPYNNPDPKRSAANWVRMTTGKTC